MKKTTHSITAIGGVFADKKDNNATLQRLMLDSLRPDPAQIRISGLLTPEDITAQPDALSEEETRQREAIKALALTIAQHGVLEPLIVFALPGGAYQIIAGERRYLAALYAEAHLDYEPLIDARVYPDRPDQALIDDIQFIENHHRENLKIEDIIPWTLRRFKSFEQQQLRDIMASDISSIMSIGSTQAYLYLAIYCADRDWVLNLLDQVAQHPVGLKEFREMADNAPLTVESPGLDELNQAAESAAREAPPQGNGINLGFCRSTRAVQALIMRATPTKQRNKYADTNWDDPGQARQAFRRFWKEWESKH